MNTRGLSMQLFEYGMRATLRAHPELHGFSFEVSYGKLVDVIEVETRGPEEEAFANAYALLRIFSNATYKSIFGARRQLIRIGPGGITSEPL